MLYNYKEAKEKFGNDYKIRVAVKSGELFRLDNGIYSDQNDVSKIELATKKYPHTIITSYSAYYLYGLIKEEPNKIYLASLRDSYRIKDSNISQSFIISALFELGKTKMIYKNSILCIYDKERMLIELIRNKKNIETEIYNEIILGYRSSAASGSLDYIKINDYVKKFGNADFLLEALKEEGFFIKGSLYQEYYSQVKEGKSFSKSDLTYDILYQMSIKENTPDSLIGDIFQMKKEQVRTLRNKYNFGNVFLRRQVDDIENIIKKIPNEEKISELELYTLYIKSCRMYCESKGWNFDIALSYFLEKSKTLPILKEALKNVGYMVHDTYQATFKNLKHIGSHNSLNRVNHAARKINQSKVNETKIKAGNLGELIVYDAEVRRLQDLGYNDLVNKIEIVTKTENSNISYDGLGYDLISFNEKKERIYIEVKCSTSINLPKINFYISRNEVKFINGELKDADKNHVFIYYVYNINKQLMTADILVITSEMFQKYELKSETYSVCEDYEEVE